LRMVQLMSLPPHCLLLHYNPDWLNVSGAGLPSEAVNQVSVCLSVCLSAFGEVIEESTVIPFRLTAAIFLPPSTQS